MEFIKTNLEDCFIIQPKVHNDKRGYFLESYNEQKLVDYLGKKIHFVQDNESKSTKGVLRGLHFQLPPYTQAKLVRVIKGKVLDVVVDLRKDSSSYGQYQKFELTAKNKKQVFVPRGFAHGYIVLSQSAIFSYKVDNMYKPSHESGIMWNDKKLNIDWGIETDEVLISEKDMILSSLTDFKSPF